MNRAKQITLNLEKAWREVLPAKLIAVSKYSSAVEVSYAYHAGQLDFGENRVADLIEKAQFFKQEELKNVRWHFIGHLQSNKVKELLRVENLVAIHSVDSFKLSEELIKRQSESRSGVIELFFQFNTSKEDEKGGFLTKDELFKAIDLFIANESKGPFKVAGLMTMATVRTNNPTDEAHRCFRELEDLAHVCESQYKRKFMLSMGMSQDHEIAKIYHTNYVRIGSQIFKESVTDI